MVLIVAGVAVAHRLKKKILLYFIFLYASVPAQHNNGNELL